MASITEQDGRLVVRCGSVLMEIDLSTGFIDKLEFCELALINIGSETGAGFDFVVDGVNVPPNFSKWESQDVGGGVGLKLFYEFDDGDASTPSTHKYVVTHALSFTERPATIERSLRIKRLGTGDLTGPDADRLRSATLLLAGVAVGEPETTSVSAPMVRIVPGTPLTDLATRPRFFESATKPTPDRHYAVCMTAPDLVPGCVALSDNGGHHVSITPIPPKCPAHLRIFAENEGITVEHEFCCSSWMDTNDEIDAGTQVIILQEGEWADAVPAIGRLLTRHFPVVGLPLPPPSWTDNAIVYEGEPTFDGGFAGVRGKLAGLKELGVNTVYLMPWHRGGYGTIDYLAPEPQYGTLEELKSTIRAAHDTGMMFLFDLLTNIIQPSSPMVKQHPEYFYRDDRGRPRPHATWGNRCLDPASPAFRRFFIDYACWCVGELGCDGFRVDADAHRGANWNSLPELQPHEHSHAVFTLLDEVRTAIRRINPNSILMPECFGPVQSSLGDMVCYQWLEWVDWAMECLATGRMTGAVFQQAIAEQIMAMPAGTKFTYYSHTHDSLAFLKRDFKGPVAEAYFASLAFLGAGVMYFGGGWGMEARPAPHEVDQYRRIFALRNELNGFRGFTTDFPEPPDIDLFAFSKMNENDCYLVFTSFAENARRFDQDGELVFSRTRGSSLALGELEVAPYDTVMIKK